MHDALGELGKNSKSERRLDLVRNKKKKRRAETDRRDRQEVAGGEHPGLFKLTKLKGEG